MPTPASYDSTRAALATQLTSARDSQLTTLTLLVLGIVQSVSIHLHRIARAMPSSGKQASKEQPIRRFLDNPRITRASHFAPLVRQAIAGLAGQHVHVVIARLLLHEKHNLLVVSLAFRHRSIPLSWKVLPHIGCSGLVDQQQLLSEALEVLPPRVRVSVHGDSEFRSQQLFGWLRAQGHHAYLGVRGDMLVAFERSGPSQPLHSLLPCRSRMVFLPAVYLTEERVGPINVLAWWSRDERNKLVLRGVMTDQPATWRTYYTGARRMWSEPMFRDWQSGGFDLERTGLGSSERLERLLLPLAIAYLWFVSVGRWVVKRGYRPLIDDGAATAWRFGLFQLGVGWKEHCLSCGIPIPLLLKVYT